MSEIRATTISDAAGTGPIALTGQESSKVRCKWNGTAATIYDSFNTASLTDEATGQFRVTFTTAMADADYGSFAQGGGDSIVTTTDRGSDNTVSKVTTYTTNMSGTGQDPTRANLSCLGDLA